MWKFLSDIFGTEDKQKSMLPAPGWRNGPDVETILRRLERLEEKLHALERKDPVSDDSDSLTILDAPAIRQNTLSDYTGYGWEFSNDTLSRKTKFCVMCINGTDLGYALTLRDHAGTIREFLMQPGLRECNWLDPSEVRRYADSVLFKRFGVEPEMA